MRAAVLFVVVALAAAAAPAAHGATVSVHVPPCDEIQSKYAACYPDEARFAAQPGEANRVTVVHSNDPVNFQPRVTIKDAGAPLTAGAGCTQLDPNTATCTGYLITAHVDLGDGDDEAAGPGVLDGGAGNDTLRGSYVLRGGQGDDLVEGEESAELIQGGSGRDTLRGAGGNDNFVDDGGAGEADTVDGGEGSDTVSYQARRTAVSVALDQPATGEDRLTGVENVRGGGGDDTLTGDALSNTLEGGGGNDRLDGGAGDDIAAGQTGHDQVNGGAGNDLVSDGEDRATNLLVCGAGRDRVDPGRNTLVSSDCETVAAGDLELVGRLELRLPPTSRRVVASIHGLSCLDLPCRLRMTVATVEGRLLGSARRVQRRRRPRLPSTVALRLSSDGLRQVLRANGLVARITIVFTDGGEVNRASFLAPI